MKGVTSNKASANMTILEMLARVLDSSVIKSESQEHVPSGWSPDGQKEVCLLPSS